MRQRFRITLIEVVITLCFLVVLAYAVVRAVRRAMLRSFF